MIIINLNDRHWPQLTEINFNKILTFYINFFFIFYNSENLLFLTLKQTRHLPSAYFSVRRSVAMGVQKGAVTGFIYYRLEAL